MNRLVLALLIALLATCGGCYDKVELNQLAVADLMAIDLSDDGRLLVSMQFVIPGELSNPSQGTGKVDSAPFYVIEAVGATLPEAFSFLQAKLPRRLFTSHIRVIILGEELAKAGIAPLFDGLTRIRELRITMDVVLARGKAADLLRADPSFESLPANALSNLLTQRVVPQRTIKDIAISLVGVGIDPFIPVVGLADRVEPLSPGMHIDDSTGPQRTGSEFEITGIAIFRDDRMVGFVPRDVARGVSWLINDVATVTTSIPWPPKETTEERVPGAPQERDPIEQDRPPGHGPESPGAGMHQPSQISQIILRAESKIAIEVRDGEIVVVVKTRSIDDVMSNQAGLDLADPTVIPKLEAAIAAQIEDRMRAILSIAQKELQADIFGFGAHVHRNHPKVWREVKADWHTVFSQLKVEISVDVDVKRVGLTNRPASLRENQLIR